MHQCLECMLHKIWVKENLFLQYQYNVKQTRDEKKRKILIKRLFVHAIPNSRVL